MKRLQFLLITMLSGTLTCYSQSQPQASAGFDLGSGFKNNSLAPSVLYHEELGLHGIPWFRVGLGIRGWGYYSDNTNLLSQNSSSIKDTVQYRNVSTNGLSFVIGANFRVWKIDLGANTDLIGIAFGSKRSGLYSKNSSGSGDGAAYYNKWVRTSPVIFNMLPAVLSNYNGQSEVYARIWVTRKLGIKFGYVYGKTAYLTKDIGGEKVFLDNRQRRFSNTYGMPFAAVTLPLL